MTDLVKNDLFRPEVTTPISGEEAFYYLRQGWLQAQGSPPTAEQLGILWSQFWLESGLGKLCRNYNYGNIRPTTNQTWTMYPCREYNAQGQVIRYNPPDYHTAFASYENYLDGAVGYITFLRDRKHYKDAWQSLLDGQAKDYIHNLKAGKYHYFTAPEDKYLAVFLGYLKIFENNYNKYVTYQPDSSEPEEDTQPSSPSPVTPTSPPPSIPLVAPPPTQESQGNLSQLSFWDKIFLTFKSIFLR